MEKQVKYKFKQLPDGAQKHVRLFQIHEFFNWSAMGITMVVLVLLLQERGFNLFDIAILMGIFSATTLLFEMPLGGLADGIGRKPVFIASLIARLVCLVVLLSYQSYFSTAIAFAIYGFGRALSSGTMGAWYIETFNRLAPRFGTLPILAKVHFASGFGLAFGAILGGFVADYFGPKLSVYGFGIYDAPLMGEFVITLIVFSLNLFFIKEHRRRLNYQAIKLGFSSVPTMMKDSLQFATRHNVISLLLMYVGLLSMTLFAIDTFWIPYAKPMINNRFAVSIIGVISAVYFFSDAFGATFSEPVVNLFKGNNAKALSFLVVLSGVCFIGLALTENIYIFVVVIIVLSLTIGAQNAPADSLFHDYVPDNKRSTLLSLRSVIRQSGGLIGMLILGFIAEKYSISTAWQIGGVIVISSSLVLLILPKRMLNTPVISSDNKAVDDD